MPIIDYCSSFSFSSPSSIFNCEPRSRLASHICLTRSAVRRSAGKFQTLLVSCSSATAIPVLSFSGDKVGEAFLDLKSASPDTARSVVHRGIITEQQNQRRGTASTLTRGEVRGGGRKPYGQKKTGLARRGSQRTPLRPGGGVIFGPKPKDWSIKINRKERRLAISTAITSAASSSDALVVEDFTDRFEAGPKTKDFIAAMKRWGLDPKEKSMFLMTEVTENLKRSCRNIGTLKLLTPRTLNLFDILDSSKLVFTISAVDYLNSTYGKIVEEMNDEEDGQQDVDVEPGDGDVGGYQSS
ncbi:hypothetical protein HPP92_013909 [Vanilla planifolia]|uniref:Large ribosomal subunit protein uL4c n=1 Tax=Vanilla planifolia TaxID=51239 RepID=A0A835QRM4_VANPL|nr:hypothetical protein HPP92_014295 [Vanilla planifolia]KAG0479190.1 hypothetical protein HPP92_013909 [Vanilla planifolia]